VPIGNEALREGFKNGELEGETRIANFSNAGMNIEELVEKGPVTVLTERLDVEEIDPSLEKAIVTVVNLLEVFCESDVEVGQKVPEEDVTLLIGFNKANLDRMEKPIHILGRCLHCHGEDFTIKGG
jgi:hypothetical protein